MEEIPLPKIQYKSWALYTLNTFQTKELGNMYFLLFRSKAHAHSPDLPFLFQLNEVMESCSSIEEFRAWIQSKLDAFFAHKRKLSVSAARTLMDYFLNALVFHLAYLKALTLDLLPKPEHIDMDELQKVIDIGLAQYKKLITWMASWSDIVLKEMSTLEELVSDESVRQMYQKPGSPTF